MITREAKSTVQSCYIFNLMVHLLNSCASQLQLIMRQKVMSCSCIWVQGSWSWVPGPGYSFQTMSTESCTCSCSHVVALWSRSRVLGPGLSILGRGAQILVSGSRALGLRGSRDLGPRFWVLIQTMLQLGFGFLWRCFFRKNCFHKSKRLGY